MKREIRRERRELGGGEEGERRGRAEGEERERRGEERERRERRVVYQSTKAAPSLIHFEECLACRVWVGLVAHVTHVGDAAEIPHGALAVHIHKSYLQEMSCTAEGNIR